MLDARSYHYIAEDIFLRLNCIQANPNGDVSCFNIAIRCIPNFIALYATALT